MTKYLNSQPFSGPTSNGRMTDLEYSIAVGGIIFCEQCKALHAPDSCPLKEIQQADECHCDCEGCQ
jgi:hypothetical protein